MKSRLVIYSVAAITALTSLAYVTLTNRNKPAPTVVNINLTGDIASSLLWVADTAGYFKGENIEPQFKVFGSGQKALEDLLSNQTIHYAFVKETPIVLQTIAGARLKVLTGLHESNKNTRVLMAGHKPATEQEGLLGKRIGLQVGSNTEFALIELLRRSGVQPNEVTIVNVQTPKTPAKLLSGEVDGIVARDQFLDEAVHLMEANNRPFWEPSLGYFHEYSFLVTDESRAATNAELSARVLTAVYKSYQLYLKNRGKFIEYSSKFASVPRERDLIKSQLERVDLVFGLNNKMLQVLRQQFTYFCLQQKSCDSAAQQRLDDAIDFSVVKQVAPQHLLAR